MGDNENIPSSGIENDKTYTLAFKVGDTVEEIGSWYRTGEPMNRMYHVFNTEGVEVGHVNRYRYVQAILQVMAHDVLVGVVASKAASEVAPDLITDLEKFLAENGGETNG